MMLNPQIGQNVTVHYRKGLSDHMPLHGRTGIVRIRGRVRPRNHGVEIDGTLYIIPSGNLQKGPRS